MRHRPVRISKFLSYLLRHHPESAGLTMDAQGWVAIEALLAASRAQKRGLTRAVLERVVAENDKQRFEIDETGTKIRARQGHSLPVDLALTAAEPPEFLYHGTSARNLASILARGLHKGNRHHIHFSVDRQTAQKVGARHGRPTVLTIRAGQMHEAGYLFFLSSNGIWLATAVPPAYIDFPEAEAADPNPFPDQRDF